MDLRRTVFRIFGRVALVLIAATMGCLQDSPSGDGWGEGGQFEESGESSISGMDFGDVELLDFGTGSGVDITFGEDSSGSTFVAVLNSTSVNQGSFSLSIQNGYGSPVEEGGNLSNIIVEPENSADAMHSLMRRWEAIYSTSPDYIPASPDHNSPLQAAVSAPEQNSTRSFKVLDSLYSVTSYTTVTARLRYIGNDTFVYVDVEMENHEFLTEADITAVGNEFDEHTGPIVRSYFGGESDVDGDGHKTVLMTPVLNREFCDGSGIVTGFFFPGDVYPATSSNPASNEMEIFYTLVPDPDGDFCRPLDVDFVMENIWNGVLPHEYEHMISYNKRVLERGGITEEPWLNEALAHLVEDLVGYGNENYSRLQLFLEAADSTTLVPPGLPTLAERGMEYMFIRYMLEQSPDPVAFLHALLNTTKSGIENIEAAFEGAESSFDEFGEFFTSWQVALVLTGTDLTDNSRYNYDARTTDPVTGNYKGVCLYCDAKDGRGTMITGPSLTSLTSFPTSLSVKSTGLEFFRISNPGSTLSINSTSGSNLGGALIRLENN